MADVLCFGIVGLGKIGEGLALHALEKGMRVVGFDIQEASTELRQAGLVLARNIAAFRRDLSSPRVVFLYVPAGPTVDEILEDLAGVLEPGDVVVDGGNSYWGDSVRRHERCAEKKLHLVDLGTSGGVEGARRGACFMAGGEHEAIRVVEPILGALAVPGGYVHAGPPGAGTARSSAAGLQRPISRNRRGRSVSRRVVDHRASDLKVWREAGEARRRHRPYGLGGHPYGPDAAIAHERRTGRVGPFPRKGAPKPPSGGA